MKKVKQTKSYLKVIFDGGVSVEYKTTHTLQELQRLVQTAMKGTPVLIDSVSEQDEIADESTVLNGNRILFAVCAEPNDSKLTLPRPGLVKLQ